MSRLALTAAVVLAFAAAGGVTARLTRPLLESTAQTPRAIAPPAPHVRPAVKEVSEIAGAAAGRPLKRTYSRPGPDGGEPRAFLQFDDYEPLVVEGEDGPEGLVRLTPFAFVYRGEPDPETGRRPRDFVLRAESARLRTERPFDLGGGGPGDILGGALEGEVTITGPDGLSVRGRNFVFNGRDLYSDEQVRFEAGPPDDPAEDRTVVRGRGDKLRAELSLAGPGREGLLGGDLPAVTGLEAVWLRRDVLVDVASQKADSPAGRPETDFLRLTCGGWLRYRPADREVRFEEDVVLRHSASPIDAAAADPKLGMKSLERCEALVLTLSGEGDPEAGGLPTDLDVVAVRALGRRLHLESTADELSADGGDFSYDLPARTARLSGGPARPGGSPPSLTLGVSGQRLYCPEAVARLGEDGLERLDCPGRGWLRTGGGAADAKVPDVQASWTGGVVVVPERDPAEEPGLLRVTAAGDVRVVQEEQGASFEGPELAFWVRADSDVRGPRPAGLAEGLPLTRVAASKGAVVRARGFDVRATELIRVDLRPIDALSGGAIRRTSATRDDAPPQSPEAPAQSRVVASAASIGMTVGVTGEDAGREAELLALAAEGDVDVRQPSAEPGGPDGLRLLGQRAEIVGRGLDQRLTVRGGDGGPVTLAADGVSLTAASVEADRAGSSVHVPGGGRVTLPATADLGGALGGADPGGEEAQTAPGEPIVVTWRESLEAAGDAIAFHGGVVVEQGGVRADCETLTVRLTRPLDFEGEDAGGSGPADVRSITLEHDVGVTAKTWEGTRLTALRRASGLASLSYDRLSGAVAGQGPGTMEQWTPHEDGGWSYERLRFVGGLSGHAARRWVRLEGGVRAVHGRVDRPLATLGRDEVLDAAGQPDDAAWLAADTLEVQAVEGPDGLTAQAQAIGHVEMEGRRFRAVADRATADGASGLFTLKADGGRTAEIYLQDGPGGAVTPTAARSIRFNPKAGTLETDGLQGFSGGR